MPDYFIHAGDIKNKAKGEKKENPQIEHRTERLPEPKKEGVQIIELEVYAYFRGVQTIILKS